MDTCTPVTEETLKPLLFQVLKALNYLRKNRIVHRDMKPENIMMENFSSGS